MLKGLKKSQNSNRAIKIFEKAAKIKNKILRRWGSNPQYRVQGSRFYLIFDAFSKFFIALGLIEFGNFFSLFNLFPKFFKQIFDFSKEKKFAISEGTVRH